MDRRRNQLLNIGEPGDSGEVVKITDVQTFPLSFWFLCLACLAYYGAIFPFVSLAKDFFRQEFDMDGQEANFITGLIVSFLFKNYCGSAAGLCAVMVSGQLIL